MKNSIPIRDCDDTENRLLRLKRAAGKKSPAADPTIVVSETSGYLITIDYSLTQYLKGIGNGRAVACNKRRFFVGRNQSNGK